MAFIPRDSGDLREGFIKISAYLFSKGAVPFFGTLLGLVRNGQPLDQDDDLDFAMDAADLRELAMTIEIDIGCFNFSAVESRIGLAQVSFELPIDDAKAIQVDVYGFALESDAMVFPVHWTNETEDERNWLRVPTSIGVVHELLSSRSTMRVPLHLQDGVHELIAYLYGSGWQTALRKNIDYRVTLQDGLPVYETIKPFKRVQLSTSHAILVWLESNPAHALTKTIRLVAKSIPANWKKSFFLH